MISRRLLASSFQCRSKALIFRFDHLTIVAFRPPLDRNETAPAVVTFTRQLSQGTLGVMDSRRLIES